MGYGWLLVVSIKSTSFITGPGIQANITSVRIKIWVLDESTGNWTAEDEWRVSNRSLACAIFQYSKLTCRSVVKAHDAPIVKLTWAHPENGSVIASCSFDRTVKIWEEKKHEVKACRWFNRATLTEARGSVRSVEFAPQHFGLKLVRLIL